MVMLAPQRCLTCWITVSAALGSETSAVMPVAWVAEGEFGDLLISCATVSMSVGLAACGADYPASGGCEGKGYGAADASSGAGDEDGLSFQAVDMAAWIDVRISGVSGSEG